MGGVSKDAPYGTNNYYWAFNAFYPEVFKLSKNIIKLEDKYLTKTINTKDDLETWSKEIDEMIELLNKRDKVINEIINNGSLKFYKLQDYLFYIKNGKYQKLDSKNENYKYLKLNTKLKIEYIDLIPKE